MSMFCELFEMAKTCSLSMTITADANTGKLTVNVLPRPKSGTQATSQADSADAALTQPLCLTATPQEFDQDFVAALRGFRECHHGLTQQAEATCKLLKAAQEASANKAATAVNKAQRPASKSATSASASPNRNSPPIEGSGNDDEGNEGEAVETAKADHKADNAGGASTGADAIQPQLFG